MDTEAEGPDGEGPAPAMSARARWVLTGLIVAIGVGVDQLTKAWAVEALADRRVIEILPTLELRLVYNSGFSFGAGAGRGRLVGFIAIAIALFLLYHIGRTRTARRTILLASVLAGALGNLVDRLVRAEEGFLTGSVIDFINVTWFAVFNVADALVTVSALVLVGAELLADRDATLTERAKRRPSTGSDDRTPEQTDQ